MRVYGLTGGIASGKSEVARRFEELGLPVIDADRIGHALLEPGGEAAGAVLEAFGYDVETCGKIDREKLAKVVFPDREARLRLNAITHPAIAGKIAARCAELARDGHAAVIVEAALLAEDGTRDAWLDGLIVVVCPAETRLCRLVELRGMDRAQARMRIEAQTPDDVKRPAADWAIANTGTLEELRVRAEGVAKEVRRHAA